MYWSLQDSIWPKRAYLLALLSTWSPFQLLLHMLQTRPQTCSLPAGQEGVEMGKEGKEGRCTLVYFPIPALQIALILWLLDDLERDCTALCSGPSPVIPLPSWENTLFSCKHQHIINMKPVFIPSSLKLHNSCNNRLPHPFIRIILAKCCIHPTTSLPQTLCKLLHISSVSACWAFFLL